MYRQPFFSVRTKPSTLDGPFSWSFSKYLQQNILHIMTLTVTDASWRQHTEILQPTSHGQSCITAIWDFIRFGTFGDSIQALAIWDQIPW